MLLATHSSFFLGGGGYNSLVVVDSSRSHTLMISEIDYSLCIDPSLLMQLRGFYRGLSFPLATSVIVNSVYYGVYGGVLLFLQRNLDGKNRATNELDYRCVFAAGCVGGLAQTLFLCPAEFVKVALQSQIAPSERE